MSIVKASRLQAVLDRARNAGHVEEKACIAGLDLVFSSLPPDAYNSILEELEDVPENSYPICYQLEHVCRSIVQVDEESFRGVKFVEVNGEDGAPPVRVECHQWLRDNLVSTWSKEMLTVAFRKVMDAIKGAEDRSVAGVQFRVEEETDEEKYRRLLGELKETGTELPDDLRDAILKEEGLLPATTKSELADLEARAKTWAQEAPEEPTTTSDAATAPDMPAEPVAAPAPPPRAPQQLLQAQASETPVAEAPRRVPLNQTPIRDPVPVNSAEQGVVMANRRSPAPPPDQVHDLTRSERVAALEGDPNLAVLEREPKVDPDQTKTIMGRPPVGGVNAKYVSPHSNPSRAGGLNPRRR
jgi:hypothetical protein